MNQEELLEEKEALIKYLEEWIENTNEKYSLEERYNISFVVRYKVMLKILEVLQEKPISIEPFPYNKKFDKIINDIGIL